MPSSVIDAAHVKERTLAAKKFDDGYSDWIWPSWRASGEHAMRPVISRRLTNQIKALGTIKGPDHEKVREAFNIQQAGPELR